MTAKHFNSQLDAARAQAQSLAAAAAPPAVLPKKPKKIPPKLYPLNVRLTLTARARVRDAAYVADISEQAYVERWAMTLPRAPHEPKPTA